MSYLNDLENDATSAIVDPIVTLVKTSLTLLGIAGAGYGGYQIYRHTGDRKVATLEKKAEKASVKLETAKVVEEAKALIGVPNE